MIYYPTTQQLIEVHDFVINKTGGIFGVLS